MEDRLTITEVAKSLNVTPRTIMRWEKAGKIKRSKRDWRGWRFYHKGDLENIRKFYESTYEYDQFASPMLDSIKNILIITGLAGALTSFIVCAPLYAATESIAPAGIIETTKTVDIVLEALPAVQPTNLPASDPVNYTLGPNDVIAIEVRRHPEFSGEYAINSEGKIQYKFVGDILTSGYTKKDLKNKLTEILSDYLVSPEVDVQIIAYLSKVFYVVGDVNRPGKFYMKGDTLTIREALIQSGLPTHAAAMRRSRLITPNNTGKNNYIDVNVYSLLYKGDLKQNFVMKPGEVLYVPATVMAKIIRVVAPITDAVGQVTGSARQGAAVAAAAL